MTIEYKLTDINLPDSMHDFRVSKIRLEDNSLILQYKDINIDKDIYGEDSNYYINHKGFRACDIIFSNNCDLDIDALVEVKKTSVNTIELTYYDIHEFIDLINTNNYEIETIQFLFGYNTVLIEADLWDKRLNEYSDSCNIKIYAERISYIWR